MNCICTRTTRIDILQWFFVVPRKTFLSARTRVDPPHPEIRTFLAKLLPIRTVRVLHPPRSNLKISSPICPSPRGPAEPLEQNS